MGVFENVEVLGRSGADLESELLHHQASQPEASLPAEPDAPPAEPGANSEATATDPDAQTPPES